MKEKRKVKIITLTSKLPFISDKQQRNTLCDCGSGKKCKKCCGATHKYYNSSTKKLKEEC